MTNDFLFCNKTRMATLDINLKKVNKIYHESERLSGLIVVMGRGDVVHSGIHLTIEGVVNMQLSAKSVGLFEAFYNSVKPITIIHNVIEIAKPGKLPSGTTELPFEINLKALKSKTMFESYHGVFININYSLKCDMKRPLLSKDLQKTCEFMVESVPSSTKEPMKEVTFKITPANIRAKKSGRETSTPPDCVVTGKLQSVLCDIAQPLNGKLVVERSDRPIKSIELQLVRVETCGCAEGYAKDATEIQNLQIADGDVYRGFTIPIYMVLPRLFTCPSLQTPNFKIEFEINLVVVFEDDHLLTENFPIKIYR